MKKFVHLFILFTYSFAFAQGEANNWIFGYNSAIHFDENGIVTNNSSSQIQLYTQEGCSSISDTNGNLLFYSDGKTVWDSNHNTMPGGANLKGNSSSTQSAVVIPMPLSTTHYYLFTVGATFNDSKPGFNYYTIDMTKNGGLGAVIDGPIDLSDGLGDTWTEKVAAVKGAECNTFWVLSYDGTDLKSYLVDSSGVNTTPVISSAPAPEKDRRGYLKVSPNGKKVAIAHFLYYNRDNEGNLPPGGDSGVILYDFDDSTGIISNELRLFDSPKNDIHPYGLEFSRQSTKLYVSTFNDSENSVYQYDLNDADIKSSENLIHSQTGYRGALQLAPDGKIYATVPVDYFTGTNYLDVINNPDELGVDCGYQENYLNLGSGMATQGLPPFIASFFSPINITGDKGDGNPLAINGLNLNLCIGDNFSIIPEPLVGNVTYEWTFNNTVVSTTEKLILTNISSSAIGDYHLEVEATDICGRTSFRNASFTINSVNKVPVSYPMTTQIICVENYDGSYLFDLNSLFNSTILKGQDSSIYEVKYFKNQSDADNNLNELPTHYDSSNFHVYARIQNINNDNCFATTSFDIELFEAALPLDSQSIESLSFCDNNSVGSDTDGKIIFDLEQKESEILNGQSSTNFTVTYFTDTGYSNQILNPEAFENTISGGQTIYVRVTNNIENSCYKDTSFEIEVLKLPVIQDNVLLKNCDSDLIADGYTDFNLEEANDFITNNNLDLTVSYHLIPADAIASSNAINPFPFNNSTANKVFARIENIEGCFRIATIDLLAPTTTFPQDYSHLLRTCDNDEFADGFHVFDLSLASNEIINLYPTEPNLSAHYFLNLNDAQLELNEIKDQENFINDIPFNQTLYVRIENNDDGGCFRIGPVLNLLVDPRPEFETDPERIICLNLPPITLETFNPNGNYTYTWTDVNNNIIGTDSTLAVNTGGIYSVIATSTDGRFCESFPREIVVKESDIAHISLEDISIKDDSNNNTITINNENNNLGIGDYEFSLDEEYGIYQNEPFFDKITPGVHTLFVRDKIGCGTISLEISVLGFPKFFSPNNDGSNDTWKILGVNETFYQVSLIYIYDRFGKIVAKLNALENGWNGQYNGTMLPSDDYWFSTILTDIDGNERVRKGHFSLIRK